MHRQKNNIRRWTERQRGISNTHRNGMHTAGEADTWTEYQTWTDGHAYRKQAHSGTGIDRHKHTQTNRPTETQAETPRQAQIDTYLNKYMTPRQTHDTYTQMHIGKED